MNVKENIDSIIEKTISGDSDAFEQLLLSKNRAILSTVRQYTRCHEDMEDICQEVALQIFKYIEGLENAQAFGAWLRTIAMRECTRYYKRQRGVIVTEDIESLENLLPETDVDALPDERAEWDEFYGKFNVVFKELPKTSRNILKLRYIRGLRYSEIAGRVGMTSGAVRAKLFRTRERLRKELLEED